MTQFTPKKPWKPTIVALSDEKLTDPLVIQLLAIICFCIKHGTRHLSRRSFANWAADVWRDFDGIALNADGASAYIVPEIDELLGGGEDGDFPWMRVFFSWAMGFQEQDFYMNSLERLRFIHLTIIAAGPLGWRNKLA